MKKLSIILLLLFAVACSQETEQKPTTPLIVNTSNGEVRFNVETASTPQELQTGLMYRTQMPLNNGMIFNIYPVRPTAMWMKNTKISLDMLFIAPDGSISMIKEHTTPMSEDLIISRDPVRAVVELNAGQASRHGIKIGDKVNHQMFNNMTTLSDEPTPAPGKIIPKGPQAVAQGPVIPKGPNTPQPEGQVIPKGPLAPNTDPNAPVIPKGPNAAPTGQVIPKGPFAPNTDPNAPVIPKGPNAAPTGQVIPKGPFAPNTDPNAPVIPKGPNAAQSSGPVPLPTPAP